MENLISAWEMATKPNYFLLEHLEEDWLGDRYASRTRTVREQFVHMHQVRLRWVEVMGGKDKPILPKLDKGSDPGISQIREALKASDDGVNFLLAKGLQNGKLPSWKGSVESFYGYLCAHEAQHRGLALVSLRISGRKIPQEVKFGLWDWGKKR